MSATFALYHYNPSFAAAIVFAAVFAISTVWHLYLMAKHRTWYFIPMIVGAILEVVGYAARAISAHQSPNWTILPFILQTLLLLVAPALLAASIYMILGHIIVSIDGESYSIIKKKWLTKIFVVGDVVTFFIQAVGGGRMSSKGTNSSRELGSHIVIAGLLLQIVWFGFFVVVALVFHSRMRAMPTTLSHNSSIPWEKFLYVLYGTSFLIMVRSIVRVVEFGQGFAGAIQSSEWYLYVFDAIPMAAVVLCFNSIYPSNFTKKAKHTRMNSEIGTINYELQQ
ncbi:RTA1 like protein-domain-containing protein [Tricladium varicosporioides]|nr:RTA1 like protein-domain-containing protein [Hymenoscyphus varicosporioides]